MDFWVVEIDGKRLVGNFDGAGTLELIFVESKFSRVCAEKNHASRVEKLQCFSDQSDIVELNIEHLVHLFRT